MQDIVSDGDSWRSQLRKGSLELAVLLALRRRSRYGLELVDLFNEAGLGISEGSIYPLLARLRTDRKIVANWVDTGVGHSHKYYELTDAGRAAVKRMLAGWKDFVAAYEQLIRNT